MIIKIFQIANFNYSETARGFGVLGFWGFGVLGFGVRV